MPVLRAEQAAQPQSQPNQGQLLLRRARAALAGHRTISAKIHQRIRLYDQELVGSGTFVQGPPEQNLLYLDLTVKVDGQDCYVQQRCDGKYFWDQRLIDGVPRLTRIDVERVAAARRASASRATRPDLAGGTPARRAVTPTPQLPVLGLGGVAQILDQFEAWCVFQRVREAKLTGPEELPVYLLEATWRPERLVQWLPDQRGAVEKGLPIDLDKLPAVLPDRMIVSLGRDDLFPRRIDYGVSPSRRIDSQQLPLVQIYFEDVQFDEAVAPQQFTFEGGVAAPVDGTDAYLLREGLLGR